MIIMKDIPILNNILYTAKSYFNEILHIILLITGYIKVKNTL